MLAGFFEGLLADPAWDILLDLLRAQLENEQVSVTSLCIAAAVPPTTGLRWIKLLEETGLIERRPDERDRRRSFLAISEDGRDRMLAFYGALKQAGLPLV